MEIYNAILGVMADVGAIGKDKQNKQQGFKYRGVDDVMNALQPAMVKHGVFVAPTILEQHREERQTSKGSDLIYSICTVKFTFYAQDGSSVDAVVIGEGMDSGDKATNKAMSIAFKYACFQVFCIPTEEMKDPDAETHPESKKVDAPPKSAEQPDVNPKERKRIGDAQLKALCAVCKEILRTDNLKQGDVRNLVGLDWSDVKKLSVEEWQEVMDGLGKKLNEVNGNG